MQMKNTNFESNQEFYKMLTEDLLDQGHNLDPNRIIGILADAVLQDRSLTWGDVVADGMLVVTALCDSVVNNRNSNAFVKELFSGERGVNLMRGDSDVCLVLPLLLLLVCMYVCMVLLQVLLIVLLLVYASTNTYSLAAASMPPSIMHDCWEGAINDDIYWMAYL